MILIAMNQKTKTKPPKGYWAQGRFVKPEEVPDPDTLPPSKTKLKAQANEKQRLGLALLTLRSDLLARLELPDNLLQALADAKKITNFEGKRRQLQFIGKLMRPLDEEPIRAAIDEQENGSAQLTLLLHVAEKWRDDLIASDEALPLWLQQHPATDVQQLRLWIRQARKDAEPTPSSHSLHAGQTQRHAKAYREIFQLVKTQLALVQEQAQPQVPQQAQE